MFPKESTSELTNLIYLGTAGMMLLAVSIIVFVLFYQRRVIRHQQEIKTINDQKQQELLFASMKGEEEERVRIAADLHDDVGITLSSVRNYFLAAMDDEQNNKEIVKEATGLLDESIDKVRSISHQLMPASLQQFGLTEALLSFAKNITKSKSLKMVISGKSLPRSSENVELAAFRVIQELTNNLIRHAHSKTVNIHSEVTTDFMVINMHHDGEGLTDEHFQELVNKKGAIGLKNITSRLKTINATIFFQQNTAQAYTITLTIPLIQPPN